jgi:hypothetical protein
MLTETEVRAQFKDLICSTCGKSAASHGLHNDVYYRKTGGCIWTWIGVIRRQLGDSVAEKIGEQAGV